MNVELKNKWVSALRSGDYKQGIGYLSKDNTFCCLGVLCEVAGLEKYTNGTVTGYKYEGSVGTCLLPDLFRYQIGFHKLIEFTVNDKKLISDASGVLTELNDDAYKSFNEIADWIEINL